MSTKPDDLNKIIADLRQKIVGKVAMPTDQIEQITLFLFLKQLSAKHDDLVRLGSTSGLIFVDEWADFHFDVLSRLSGDELVKQCRDAIESLYKNPNIDDVVRKVFDRSYLKILDAKVLSSFISYLEQNFSTTLDLGDFYESLLPILGTQNQLGQFRTPRHIIDFIVDVVDPSIGESIVDPACGTAGFLVSAFNYLKQKYSSKNGTLDLNPDQLQILYNKTIFGWDMEPLMVKFSLANMYLHGLKVPNVTENDTLANEDLWGKTYDLIVANPPFITPKDGASRHSKYSISSNKTEVLFLEYMVKHLNFNGRMGVIVPEGIVFDQGKGHQTIRKMLIENGLWAVVSLPKGTFQPYSPVKTSIIFMDKTYKGGEVLFAEVANHGFSLNTNPTPISDNELPNILSKLKSFKNGNEKYLHSSDAKCFSITHNEILAQDVVSLIQNVYLKKDFFQSDIPEVTLGEVCDIYQPKTITGDEILETGLYRVYGANGIIGYFDEFNHAEAEVVLGCRGSVGTVHFTKEKSWITGNAMVVHPKNPEELDKEYLYLLLNYLDLKPVITGSAQPQITRASLSPLKIPLLDFDEQKTFVAEVSKLQNVIDGIHLIHGSYRPDYVESQDWEEVSLSDESWIEFIDGDRGTNYPSKNQLLPTGDCLFLNAKNVTFNGFRFETNEFIDSATNAKLRKGKLVRDDIVLTTRGTIGNSAIYDESVTYDNLRINSGMVILRVNQEKILPKFFWYLIQSSKIQREFEVLSRQASAQPQLSIRNMKTLVVRIPSKDIQSEIVRKLDLQLISIRELENLLSDYRTRIKDRVVDLYPKLNEK